MSLLLISQPRVRRVRNGFNSMKHVKTRIQNGLAVRPAGRPVGRLSEFCRRTRQPCEKGRHIPPSRTSTRRAPRRTTEALKPPRVRNSNDTVSGERNPQTLIRKRLCRSELVLCRPELCQDTPPPKPRRASDEGSAGVRA